MQQNLNGETARYRQAVENVLAKAAKIELKKFEKAA